VLTAIELTESLAKENAFLRRSLITTLGTAALLGVVTALIAMFLGLRQVGRPVSQLVAHARRIGLGEFDKPLRLSSGDEMSILAEEMNAMASHLAKTRDRLNEETRAREAAIEQLRLTDRLRTVGTLASGVAHELGTPLNVVSMRAKMVADGDVDGDEARVYAKEIFEASNRMTRIIRQLLDFARPSLPERAPNELRAVTREVLSLLRPIIDSSGVAVRLLDGPAIEANIDRAQWQQVLINLVINAIAASRRGGEVRVSIDQREAEIAGGPTTPVAATTVQDEGEGIAPDILPRVFEPFFTTKGAGEGTGLGLAIAFGIVREHGGMIHVSSVVGHGSEFSVLVPILQVPKREPQSVEAVA
jgi:signal transduction histidine kinase